MGNMSKRKGLALLLLFVFLVVSVLFICSDTKPMLSGFHSSRLKQRTTKEGNTVRIDYVDDSGTIRNAVDAGYATRIVVKSDTGTIENYLDDKGELIKRYYGYYGILREYDENGNNVCVTYLDIDGNPLDTKMGYATEERIFNNNKQITVVRYKDASGAPALTSLYGYGKINKYDDNGKAFMTTYVDISGQPMMTDQGYASIIRYYYTTGKYENKVEHELYLDDKDCPIKLSLGQYGVHKEYDEYGRESILTYLDVSGNPLITNKGYTTVVRTFLPNNSVATERYFDMEGKPFSLSEGQYGIKNENGQTIYLDRNSDEILNLRRLLYNQSWIIIPIVIFFVILSAILNRKMNYCLLVIYVLCIAYFTLLLRDNEGTKIIGIFRNISKIFTDSEARADVIKNIWLFIPLGALLYKLWPNNKIILAAVALSTLLEGIQLLFGIGFFEPDDIICNSLGGLIGFYTSELTTNLFEHIIKRKQINSI